MNKKPFALSLLLFCVFLGGCGLLWLFTVNDPGANISVVVGQLSADRSIDDYDYYMDITIGEGWENANKNSPALYGTQYDFLLHNNTGKDLNNWEIVMHVPEDSYIDSSWSGEYVMTKGDGENLITVTCTDYNEKILGHTALKLGMVMYTPEEITASYFKTFDLKARMIRRVVDNPMFWLLALGAFTVLVIFITNLFSNFKYRRMREKFSIYREVTDQALNTFARIIDAKDEYTSGHSYRVGVYARNIAKRMGLDEDEQERYYHIALLHDIGKIGVPDSILTGRNKLTDEERSQIQRHVTLGGNILMEFSSIPGIDDGARYHHERYDGTGYATGLAGEDIPLVARIICVADAFDAMNSARSYRPKLEMDHILRELRDCSGTQFDPVVVKHMIDMINDGSVPINSAVPRLFRAKAGENAAKAEDTRAKSEEGKESENKE